MLFKNGKKRLHKLIFIICICKSRFFIWSFSIQIYEKLQSFFSANFCIAPSLSPFLPSLFLFFFILNNWVIGKRVQVTYLQFRVNCSECAFVAFICRYYDLIKKVKKSIAILFVRQID